MPRRKKKGGKTREQRWKGERSRKEREEVKGHFGRKEAEGGKGELGKEKTENIQIQELTSRGQLLNIIIHDYTTNKWQLDLKPDL